MTSLLRALVMVEVVVCFAMPTYVLFWGVVSLPLWLGMASKGAGFALVNALSVVGGCLGWWALARLLLYYLSPDGSRQPVWRISLAAVGVGVASIWSVMTGQFTHFALDGFYAKFLVAPTLCAAHLVWLTMRKSKRGGANSIVQAA